jgi:hypothetical protein
MLDAVVERVFASVLDRCAGFLGQGAKILELSAFCGSLLAAALIARHLVWQGLTLFAFAQIAAAVAARTQATPLTDIYRSVAFAALPFAFALDAPERALAATFFMFGIAANNAVAMKFGRTPVGASELLIAFILAGVFPAWFGLIAYAGGVLCFVAAGIEASRRAG